ncbi:restriction endonuclease subunit S [Eshraghiella crossota]|uniref:restriction endonuclease subunit S n=1 Tax=Eshraghiella crossota TaxID=45851 RepID=UPI004028F4D9
MSKKPNIRFKEFSDDWEQRKLGELCERVTRKNKNVESDLPLTIASQYGLIDQRNFFNKVVAAKDMSNYYLLKKGEFAYNKSYSKGFDYGSIKRLNVYEQGCLSTLYICFGIKSDDVESDYLECFFDTLKWYSDITMICAEGARNHGLLNVDTKAFFDEVTITMPSHKEEQRKISVYLNNLDHLITLHQRKCDKLKELKKHMLKKMFPQNNEKFPEYRFDGFTDPWEQRKLGELCERVTRKNKNVESDLPLTIASQYGLIDQRNFFNKVVAAKDMSNYYLLKKGEFAYNKSYSKGFDYGSIKRLNVYEQGCLSTLYICFGIKSDDVESDYLECFFDTLKWYSDITMICAEGARNHGLLNVDTKAFFDEVTITMPSHKEEQRKISVYLNNLDHLITLHQRKVDNLKIFKKFMLKKMFV